MNTDAKQGRKTESWDISKEMGPVETRLNEYGVNGRVLGLVIGGYGEFSSDVYNLVELAVGQATDDRACSALRWR